MITKQIAINVVLKELEKSGLDTRVYYPNWIREYEWGWEIRWMSNDPRFALYGSSPYLVHKNGKFATINQVRFNSELGEDWIMDEVIEKFVELCEEEK